MTASGEGRASADFRAPADFQEHLTRLEEKGLLVRIDRPICKDTELHPLVRWQFVGNFPEDARRAFLFTNVVGAGGEKYDIPVVVGALAATNEIYAMGMGLALEDLGEIWMKAIDEPIPPVFIEDAPCQEVVITGDELQRTGLSILPAPVSTPGFDAAPYLTATLCVTKDPETGVRNMGTYRAGFKANDRLGVRMASRLSGAGGYVHWLKYQKLGQPMPCAIIVGCAPVVAFTGPQKLGIDEDEMAVAGGLAGRAMRVTRAKTVDLEIPADAEIVVEGFIDTELLEPEGPFGESHGHVALEDFNMSMRVTAITITMKKKPVFASVLSEVTPSESSILKKSAYEALFYQHLRRTLDIKGIIGVTLHEPLTNLRKVIFLRFKQGAVQSEVWRALNGAASLQAQCGKIVIAVSEDIDTLNADAIFWSMAYRSNPVEDVLLMPHRAGGHGPKAGSGGGDSTMLVDATLKHPTSPLALPAKPFMENARKIWEELDLPALSVKAPWHGYDLGDWSADWQGFADAATRGEWKANGANTFERRRAGLKPETPVRKVEGKTKS